MGRVTRMDATAREDAERAGRRRGGLLRQRDFGLLWLGETASGLGNSVTAVALPLVAVVTLHSGPTAVGLLAAAVWLPWLLIGLPAGAWVDRLRKKPVPEPNSQVPPVTSGRPRRHARPATRAAARSATSQGYSSGRPLPGSLGTNPPSPYSTRTPIARNASTLRPNWACCA